MSRRTAAIATILSLTATAVGAVASPPALVSPGAPEGISRIDTRCPTFSWGAVPNASVYELLIYLLPEGEVDANAGEATAIEPVEVLHRTLPGSALSWTPSLEECFEPGERYGWALRAIEDEGPRDWSEASFFQIVPTPSPEEVARAVELLQIYIRAHGQAKKAPDFSQLDAGSVATQVRASAETPSDPSELTEVHAAELATADKTGIKAGLPDTTGVVYGIHGVSNSSTSLSAGVVGQATATSGAVSGLLGVTASAAGAGAVLENTAGGPLLLGLSAGQKRFLVSGTGVVSASSYLGDGSSLASVDAETLDSHDSTYFMPAATDIWVDEGGDSMSGTLSITTTPPEHALVTSGGWVGIGTPTPGFPLDISGNVNLGADLYKGGTIFLHDQGSANTAVGLNAMTGSSSGGDNTAFGYRALHAKSSGFRNTAVGSLALHNTGTGSDNTALGGFALETNTDGIGSTAVGSGALRFNTHSGNTGVGYHALWANTSGGQNAAVGWSALEDSQTGEANTAVGFQALENSGGNWNTAVGKSSLQNCGSNNNTALGVDALKDVAGASNIGIGVGAGVGAGERNIYIGASAGTTGESDHIRIGSYQDTTYIQGIYDSEVDQAVAVLVTADGQLGVQSSSRRFKQEIRDMGDSSARLLDLRPVTFRYRQAAENGEQPLQYGLIAEEVAEVFPELVAYDRDGIPYTVYYHKLPALLLNELHRQQRKIEGQEKELRGLRERLAELEGRD